MPEVRLHTRCNECKDDCIVIIPNKTLKTLTKEEEQQIKDNYICGWCESQYYAQCNCCGNKEDVMGIFNYSEHKLGKMIYGCGECGGEMILKKDEGDY